MKIIEFNEFLDVDMRVGVILRAEPFVEAIKPAIKLWIEFGGSIGLKQSSAQITEYYSAENLVGKKIIAVVNLKPRQIASFMSEVLVLGAVTSNGVTLLSFDRDVDVGARIY